jgi:hypothetical protein
MVDTRLLSGVEVLVVVIETGSSVRAAEALGLSDFGVSRAVTTEAPGDPLRTASTWEYASARPPVSG